MTSLYLYFCQAQPNKYKPNKCCMGNCCTDCCEIAKYSSKTACHVWSRLLEPPEQMSPA